MKGKYLQRRNGIQYSKQASTYRVIQDSAYIILIRQNIANYVDKLILPPHCFENTFHSVVLFYFLYEFCFFLNCITISQMLLHSSVIQCNIPIGLKGSILESFFPFSLRLHREVFKGFTTVENILEASCRTGIVLLRMTALNCTTLKHTRLIHIFKAQ